MTLLAYRSIHTRGVAAMSALSSEEVYTRLMAMHHDAGAAGRYDVSYYLLSAHDASCCRDGQRGAVPGGFA